MGICTRLKFNEYPAFANTQPLYALAVTHKPNQNIYARSRFKQSSILLKTKICWVVSN